MKRITFMLIAVFAMLVSYAAGPQKRMLVGQMLPTATQLQLGQKFDAKKAPKQLAKKQLAKVRALKKAVAAADFVSDYQWDYEQAKEYSTDLESLETTSGSSRVTIAESAATEGGITISGMFSNDLEATIESDENGDYFVIEGGSQTAGTSSYGDYTIQGLFYYEGDDENDAGWYYGDIYGYLLEDGTIAIYPWICRVLTTGEYEGYTLTPYWVEGSTLTPAEALIVVEAPKDLVTEEYSISARNYKDDADVSGSVFIGFDGNDVYVQGLCTWLPDAWVKGTLDGTTITFATGQYLGNYNDLYDMFLNVLLEEDVVFEYDEKEGSLTAKNEVFLVDNSQYYFDSYRGCVLKKVVEKAAMPANPAITALTNSSYGWYFTFNVPNVDVDGNGLASSKLSYMIYTDTEGEIAPLTFTPETHSRLEEAITEIPFGFTENYDFYATQIYLNDLYSADWNNLGIKSIYRGGGEENETEIQWFHIKDYATSTGDFTFDFNKMSVPTSTNNSSAGDITENFVVTEGSVTLTVTPSGEGATSVNRFWSTTAGPQLRMYGGTMTFEVPEGLSMTNMVFNYAKWGKDDATNVTADSGTLTDDAENKVATWAGEAQKVVISVGANTQLNSIVVTVEGGEVDDKLVVLPEGVVAEEYTMYYEDKEGENTSAKTVNVAVDGNDVYFQNFSDYLPEAWVKGTKDGNKVTFPPMQLFGEYEGYESYAFYGEDDVVFTYDAEADTYTAEGEIYGVLGDQYYDGHYFNPVIKKVADKAAMPANPEITAMENGSYGWYIDFTVPPVDVNGEDLAIGKLSYMIYTDTQGEVSPLTFTPDTHTKLTQSMTEIPYGFTENYDFYADEIYLNDLYSSDWTRIGIQSIYRGGGEENKTEIQWFEILPDPEPIEAPEDLETETYVFSATEIVVVEEEGEAARRAEGETKMEEYSYQMQVGFDGNDVYFKGVSDDTADMWLKGTLSQDGKTVTIPANQYMGQIDFYGYFTYDYFFTAVAEDGETMEDIVLNYNAEASTFTTDQTLVLHDGKRSLGEPYQVFNDVVITKMVEFAATPADPSIDSYKFEGAYPYIDFAIPAKDVDGNDIISAKLFYTVWIEDGNDGIEKPFVVLADEYKYVEDDLTEIPYDWDDSYDIYKGGSRFYINPANVIGNWTKFGIQSIYYGGGERNTSNIIWLENPVYTAITNVNFNNEKAVIFDMQGRRVANPVKGLYIVNGKKAVLK